MKKETEQEIEEQIKTDYRNGDFAKEEKEIKETTKISTFEDSEPRIQHCEKCGKEIGNRLIDDEVVAYCKDCNWITR